MKKKDDARLRPIPPIPTDVLCTGRIDTDPLGSYTGRPDNALEEPVQDADDL